MRAGNETGLIREKGKKGISGSTLKTIALVSMLIDHIALAIFTRVLIRRGAVPILRSGDLALIMGWIKENALLYFGTDLMRMIGRIAFPLFCFGLVQGFQKTRSIPKYLFRLILFALISEVPFDLALSGTVMNKNYQNVYFTLLLGLLALWGFSYIEKCSIERWGQLLLTVAPILLFPCYAARRAGRLLDLALVEARKMMPGLLPAKLPGSKMLLLYLFFFAAMIVVWLAIRRLWGDDAAWRTCADLGILAAAMEAAAALRTDYAGTGVLAIAMIYFLRKRGARISFAGGCLALTLLGTNEIWSFFGLIPVSFYNGERGVKLKYIFYAVYPIHLFLLWLVCYYMGMGWISAI